MAVAAQPDRRSCWPSCASRALLSVAMDIVFAEPDRTAPSRVFPGWGLQPDDPLAGGAGAARHRPGPDPGRRDRARPRRARRRADRRRDQRCPVKRKAGVRKIGGKDIDPEKLGRLRGRHRSLPILQEAAARHRQPSTPCHDRDGIVRRVPLLVECRRHDLIPAWRRKRCASALGEKSYIVKSSGAQGTGSWSAWRDRDRRFAIGTASNLPIKTDPSAQVWLHDTGHRTGALRAGLEGLAGRGRPQRQHRVRRHQRARPAGLALDAQRHRHSRRRDPRADRRADPDRRFPRAAALGERSGVRCSADSGRRHDRSAAAAGRRPAARSWAASACVAVAGFGWWAFLRSRLADRSGLSVGRRAGGVHHRRAAVVPALRHRAQAGARDVQPLSRAGDGEAAGRPIRACCAWAARCAISPSCSATSATSPPSRRGWRRRP